MKVTPGVPEAPPPTFLLRGPGHMLLFAAGHRCADVGVAGVRTIATAIQCFTRWEVTQNRCDPFEPIAKAHVVIKFIPDTKGWNTTGDRMFWELLEIGGPDRVDRPMRFKVSPGPIQKPVSRLTLGNLDPIVHANNADTFFMERIDLLEMRNYRMARAAIGVEDNRVGVIQRARVFRPSIAVNNGLHLRYIFVQRHGQQGAACIVFVRAA